jgi:hypothetical protein
MTTTVVNIRDLPNGWQDDPQYVYIGRANAYYGLTRSKWANPFRIGRDGTRNDVLSKYLEFVLNSDYLLGDLPDLADKTLVCFCAPLPCHGDILAKLVERIGA